MLGRTKSARNRRYKRKRQRKFSDEERKSLAASVNSSWFRREDSWYESFAEPKSPVSACEWYEGTRQSSISRVVSLVRDIHSRIQEPGQPIPDHSKQISVYWLQSMHRYWFKIFSKVQTIILFLISKTIKSGQKQRCTKFLHSDFITRHAKKWERLLNAKCSICSLEALILFCTGKGGGVQSARANFKDSYLRNEYRYCNKIWWFFITFIEQDNSVLIKPVPIKPLPWQPFFRKPFWQFSHKFDYFKFFYSNT